MPTKNVAHVGDVRQRDVVPTSVSVAWLVHVGDARQRGVVPTSVNVALLRWCVTVCRLSICADAAAIVGQSASAVLSHKQQSADLGKVFVVVYNRGWSD